ncbi:myomesin-1 isoform X1 [Gadus chalcogrammus]|uniref:myomesin-1 isoform X1 n=2 Tax=Gadus chalcogrammus TaxID=1042646 RepID=UPI0024C4918B|nr:myomesin-1 isoform X1 [Gadus chalcogrammus]
MPGSLPFYQKHQRHYDHDYRSSETQALVSKYRASSRSSSGYPAHTCTSGGYPAHTCNSGYAPHICTGHGLTSARTSTSRGLTASSYTGLEQSSQLTKRAKATHLAVDREHHIIGYVVPIFRGSLEFAGGYSGVEDSRLKATSASMWGQDHFTSGLEMERSEVSSRKVTIRESAERISLSKTIYENEEHSKRMNKDSLMHAPEFVIKPRSHTVWENQSVRLHCTLSGWPNPHVVWYKNNVTIDPIAHPGKYKIESSYSVHSLEIDRCDFDDTAQYHVSAMNAKGEQSAYASVVVKRFKGEMDTSAPSPRRSYPRVGQVSEYGITFKTHIVDTFGVSFGREGETMSLGCTVIIHPNLERYQPGVEWYRDDVLLAPSKWHQMHWSGDRATLTLTHLNKEDEGLYTLRVTTKSGYETYSAYVFVRDADAEVEGAPGAPLDVRCLDANKDYVIVSWKQPAVDGGNSILGYFVDRCEVGTNHWIQCNDTPVKFARLPVTGLVEGRSYAFRVRAVNKSGMSHPSRTSEPVAAVDAADRTRMRGTSAPVTGQIIVTEEEPAEGVVPGKPLELEVTEATKNYVVLSWKPPGERGHEGIMYYVEKCVSGTDSWQRVNTEIPVKSPRFALFDLAEGKSYSFRVRCCNSAGVGEPSPPTEATTVGDKLDVPAAPERVVATRNTDTSVVVSWEKSRHAKDLVGYYIETSVVGSDTWGPCNNKPVPGSRFVCHGLVTGETYVFKVRAVNAAGISVSSQESEPVLVKAAIGGGIPHASPAPPFGISVLECVRDSMVLGWKQPAFVGGSDITGYFVDYREVIDGLEGQWHEANIQSVSDRAYRVCDLKENKKYQFQVRAANMAGVGIPSLPSNTFLCEEWTIAVPGPPHDLQVTEVRSSSLVLLWKPPVYQGRDAVNGFYVDIKEAGASEEAWRGINKKATDSKFIKIENLQEGEKYVFRVRAQNNAGVGNASEVTEPTLAETKAGTKEIMVDVDDDGVISLNFECSAMSAESKFVWSKNYEEISDTERIAVETKGSKAKASFLAPGEEDIGIYSCSVTHTDGASASYDLTAEELKKLLETSHDHKFPIIPLKSELAVELQEKGRVRFWLQAEKISANGKVDYVFNDNSLSAGEKYKMNFDKNTGVIEMIMESLTPKDEGTFTFQLQDGKATNQSSLVLIGDVFKALQKESEFQMKEWVRKQGPHFVEYLGFEVTPECCVILKCKVGNIKKDTVALWQKDGQEIKSDQQLSFTEGVLKLEIAQISKKDAGVYNIVLKDDRGKDTSTLNLTDQGFRDMMNEVFSVIANSSTALKITSTDEGIRLYTFVSYYNDLLQVTWHYKDSAISFSDRIKSGVVGEQLWLQIKEPTEKDTGKYAIEFNDGKGGLRRTVELSGQAFDDAVAEFKRLKAAAIAERNRARVKGGLPDVVTIQEGKDLNLTCNISGDPVPEVTWLKNEREIVSDDHLLLKFESGKFASFIITKVNSDDSGKYSILVKNKFGTESGEFTLQVTQGPVDLGVTSYLTDQDGNVMVGPNTTPPKKRTPATAGTKQKPSASPVPKTPPPGKQVDGRENVEQVKETGRTVTEDTAETPPAPTATGTTPETPQHPDAELCDEAASPSGSPEETTAQ